MIKGQREEGSDVEREGENKTWNYCARSKNMSRFTIAEKKTRNLFVKGEIASQRDRGKTTKAQVIERGSCEENCHVLSNVADVFAL